MGGRPLHRADANVARGDAGEHGAFAHRLAIDRLACRHHRQAARGRDAERVHRLADDVFPQHRTERGTAVAAAREPRLSRAFQLDVDALAGGRDLFTEQNGAAVAEGGEVAELVTGVGLRDRPRAFRQRVAGEDCGAFGLVECRRVEAERRGQWPVKGDQTRLAQRAPAPPPSGRAQAALCRYARGASLPCLHHIGRRLARQSEGFDAHTGR